MVPPAPPRFSITIVCNSGLICSAHKRPITSTTPPAENGTIRRSGRSGYADCAYTGAPVGIIVASEEIPRTTTSRLFMFVIAFVFGGALGMPPLYRECFLQPQPAAAQAPAGPIE